METNAHDTRPDCLLTLALPAALELEALDLLLAEPGRVDDVSIAHVEALGEHVPLVTAMEKVRGRARRSMLMLVTRTEHVAALTAAVTSAFPGSHTVWWTTALTAYGEAK
ncbi:DUF3240 family protein [Lacisediminimonas profundi]|uniref:DUF3240 family protein n=1 Tax=Lacisediminimonas profundi TaxID=2603856 RepID=UPI0019D657CC|nr:DUF3240 family protein [Lacisediminimonas profundi]